MNYDSLLRDRRAVLATMHQKERVMAPLLEREMGMTVLIPENFDTDPFGTFTREVKRLGTQIEAARLKAEKAMSLVGETLAIASEGSFGPHPLIPYLAANREIVILVDRINQLEIVGESISEETNYSHKLVSSLEEAYHFAKTAGFPEHGLVAILGEATTRQAEIVKGITTEQELADVVETSLKRSPEGKVHLETDMRAMYNPTRMKNIARATLDLIQKMKSQCPQCGWPGFQIVKRQPGLPCGLCYLPTQLVRSAIYQCQKCGFSQEELFPDGQETADPSLCSYCNP